MSYPYINHTALTSLNSRNHVRVQCIIHKFASHMQFEIYMQTLIIEDIQ